MLQAGRQRCGRLRQAARLEAAFWHATCAHLVDVGPGDEDVANVPVPDCSRNHAAAGCKAKEVRVHAGFMEALDLTARFMQPAPLDRPGARSRQQPATKRPLPPPLAAPAWGSASHAARPEAHRAYAVVHAARRSRSILVQPGQPAAGRL